MHNQVRAWAMTFGMYDIVAPVAELDGERVKLLRTSLVDPGGDARRVECGDGPIWIVESELGFGLVAGILQRALCLRALYCGIGRGDPT